MCIGVYLLICTCVYMYKEIYIYRTYSIDWCALNERGQRENYNIYINGRHNIGVII